MSFWVIIWWKCVCVCVCISSSSNFSQNSPCTFWFFMCIMLWLIKHSLSREHGPYTYASPDIRRPLEIQHHIRQRCLSSTQYNLNQLKVCFVLPLGTRHSALEPGIRKLPHVHFRGHLGSGTSTGGQRRGSGRSRGRSPKCLCAEPLHVSFPRGRLQVTVHPGVCKILSLSLSQCYFSICNLKTYHSKRIIFIKNWLGRLRLTYYIQFINVSDGLSKIDAHPTTVFNWVSYGPNQTFHKDEID